MNDNIVFVYSNGREIKVYGAEEAKKFKQEGWVHTATLNACTYIQYLTNNKSDKDILETVKDLLVNIKIRDN